MTGVNTTSPYLDELVESLARFEVPAAYLITGVHQGSQD